MMDVFSYQVVLPVLVVCSYAMLVLVLFRGELRSGLLFLAVAGVLNSVLSAYYCLKIVVAMYMSKPQAACATPSRAGFTSGIALAISLAGTFILGLFPGRLLDVAQRLYGAMR